MVGGRSGYAKKEDQLVAAWDEEAVDAPREGAAEPARRPQTKHSSIQDMVHLLPVHLYIQLSTEIFSVTTDNLSDSICLPVRIWLR
jgi:hypothetical protein